MQDYNSNIAYYMSNVNTIKGYTINQFFADAGAGIILALIAGVVVIHSVNIAGITAFLFIF